MASDSAKEYLKEVERELERRVARLASVIAEIEALEASMRVVDVSRGIRQGNVLRITSTASYQSHLKGQLSRKREEQKELQLEVDRARERKVLVEEEIAFLEENEEAEEPIGRQRI